MKTFVIVSCLLAVACALALPNRALNKDLDEHWANFKEVHNKKYAHREQDVNRRLLWEMNVEAISAHNLLFDLGETTYKMGLNKYSDMAPEEFYAKMSGYRPGHKSTAQPDFTATKRTLPDSIDWRSKGYVTPVKNQEQCGSGYAFSATGSIEGQNFKKTGNLIPLSEQQLVDCGVYNNGCTDGNVAWAFSDIVIMGGIETEEVYPYTATNGTCKFDSNAIAVRLIGDIRIAQNEDALKEAVATIGPISIAIDANGFHHYKGGIYNNVTCDRNSPNHASLIVGYGTEQGQDYWLVKNSWGTSWGEEGYIKMSRNHNNQCGIANIAFYPVAAVE